MQDVPSFLAWASIKSLGNTQLVLKRHPSPEHIKSIAIIGTLRHYSGAFHLMMSCCGLRQLSRLISVEQSVMNLSTRWSPEGPCHVTLQQAAVNCFSRMHNAAQALVPYLQLD